MLQELDVPLDLVGQEDDTSVQGVDRVTSCRSNTGITSGTEATVRLVMPVLTRRSSSLSCSAIDLVVSVEPSLTMINSSSCQVWRRTLCTASDKNASALYAGMITDTREEGVFIIYGLDSSSELSIHGAQR